MKYHLQNIKISLTVVKIILKLSKRVPRSEAIQLGNNIYIHKTRLLNYNKMTKL